MKLPILASLAFVVMVTADARAAGLTVGVAERLAAVPNGPGRRVLDAALAAYNEAAQDGTLARPDLLTVIDYTRPSTERRLWVLDLARGRVLFHELVQTYDQKSNPVTLAGLAERSADLSARADAWRRTLAALRTGLQ